MKRTLLFCGILILILPSQIFCYETNHTHPKLTESAIVNYKIKFPLSKFVNYGENVKSGSVDEDYPDSFTIPTWARYYNHFLGQNNAGLGEYPNARDFALISGVQTSWRDYILNTYPFLKGTTTEDKFIKDFSWEKAKEQFSATDISKGSFAYTALGHVTHLLEDMGSPPHVWNDVHVLDFWADTTISLKKPVFVEYAYEYFVNSKLNNNINFIVKQPSPCNNAECLFDKFSSYTRSNFFSTDYIHIDSNWKADHACQMANEDGKEYVKCFLIDEDGQTEPHAIRVARKGLFSRITPSPSYTGYDIEIVKYILDENVYGDYWDRLAPKTAQYVASLINLYHKEVGYSPLTPPTVSTGIYTSVTTNSVTLNGTVNPNGLSTNVLFEYGTDPTLTVPTSSPSQDVGSGMSDQAVAIPISGLTGGTTYYYRIVATNVDGTQRGNIASFATTVTPPVCVPTLEASKWITVHGQVPVFSGGSMTVGATGPSTVMSTCEFTPPVALSWNGCLSSTNLSYHFAGIGKKNPLWPGQWDSIIPPSIAFGTRWETPNTLLSYLTNNNGVYYFGGTNTSPTNNYFCGQFDYVWGTDRISMYYNGNMFYEVNPQTLNVSPEGPVVIQFQGYDRPVIVESISVTTTTGPQTWVKTLDGPNATGKSVEQTSDGGYIVTGNKYWSVPGVGAGTKVILIKTDDAGNVIWEKTFQRTWNDGGNSVRQTSDGGYIIVGLTTIGYGGTGIYLIKTDANGVVTWEKTSEDYGYGASYSAGITVRQVTGGGYIILGNIGTQSSCLVRTDEAGNMLWKQDYQGRSIRSMQQTLDGGYILAGSTLDSYGFGGSDIYMAKTDSSGNILWEKTYGEAYNDYARSAQQTSDGGYILAGTKYSFARNGYFFYLLKTDSNGNTLWENIYDVTDGQTVSQTADGGYISLRNKISLFAGVGELDCNLLKTDVNGNILWEKKYGGPRNDTCYSVSPTSDGGYIIVGDTVPFDYAGTSVYLIKTDGIGNVGQ